MISLREGSEVNDAPHKTYTVGVLFCAKAISIAFDLERLWFCTVWLVLQACVQGRLDSTTTQLEKLRKHLEIVNYGDKTDTSVPEPGSFTSNNPAAAKVRTTLGIVT